ncbi:MAG: acyltransferase family protein [Gemmatimonadota bacterium]
MRRSLGDLLSQSHLPALDGLRAVSVFVVVLGHHDRAWSEGPGRITSWSVEEYVGVLLFFVLSGFLITHLLLREHQETGRVAFGRFFARRALRLLPAYYTFFVVSVGLWLLRGFGFPAGRVIAGAFYGMNYWNALAPTSDPQNPIYHVWSLAVEEQFYLLWPPLLLWAARRGRKTVERTLWCIIATAATWRCGLMWWDVALKPYAYNAFDARADNLAIGCLLAVLVRDDRWRARFERLAADWWMPVATAALLALSVFAGSNSDRYRYGPALTLEAILSGLLMMQLLLVSALPGWRWLDHPLAVWLGRLSYPIYLWHVFALGLDSRIATLPIPVRVVLVFALAVAFGAVSYYVVERPFLRMKGRFAAPR